MMAGGGYEGSCPYKAVKTNVLSKCGYLMRLAVQKQVLHRIVAVLALLYLNCVLMSFSCDSKYIAVL